jgi:hypothetical protein
MQRGKIKGWDGWWLARGRGTTPHEAEAHLYTKKEFEQFRLSGEHRFIPLEEPKRETGIPSIREIEDRLGAVRFFEGLQWRPGEKEQAVSRHARKCAELGAGYKTGPKFLGLHDALEGIVLRPDLCKYSLKYWGDALAKELRTPSKFRLADAPPRKSRKLLLCAPA